MTVLKAAGVGGTIMVILALIVTLLKQLSAFIALIMYLIGFLTFAVKILIVLAFVIVIAGVGFVIFRSFQNGKKNKS